MKKTMLTFMRFMLWTIAGVVILISLIVSVIYIPPCQDFIFKKVIGNLNNNESGMHVEYERLRLKFPAHIEGNGVKASMPGDMEIYVGDINGNVALFPLI